MQAFPHITGIRFTDLLGQGGMAAVYSAVETALDREVAVKVVGLSGDDPQSQQRLENEARALAGLRHPHIIELYRYGRTREGALYYVMPRLRGGDLSTWHRPIEEERALRLLDALLDALAHAHAAGIVHRDIKPENILFDNDQRPVLADFGAAQRPTGSRLTQEGMTIGSTGYMSPEQARGQVVDARSDLYSVGVLAFELLTGRLPYDGQDSLAVALAQAEQPVPRLPPALAHWQRLIDRSLAFSPSRRFRDANEMREALSAVSAARQQRLRRVPARRSLGPALAIIALFATVAAVIWWSGRTAVDQAEIAGLLARGDLAPPSNPNALDLLMMPDARALPEWPALRQQLLAALEADLHSALALDDLLAVRAPFERWHHAVVALDAQQTPQAGAMRSAIDAAIADRLQRALDRYDRDIAQPALQLLQALPQPLPESLLILAARARALPREGERFADPDGPPLVLVRRPSDGRAGLAVMTAAVDPALYAQFRTATGRAARECAAQDAQVQGCVGLDDARAFAQWLSARTDAQYTVPERDELAALLDQVDDADALAWTSTCRPRERVTQPNLAQRTWGGIRNVFGGARAQAKVERYCDGYYAVPLDGAQSAPDASTTATPRHTVVLVREVK